MPGYKWKCRTGNGIKTEGGNLVRKLYSVSFEDRFYVALIAGIYPGNHEVLVRGETELAGYGTGNFLNASPGVTALCFAEGYHLRQTIHRPIFHPHLPSSRSGQWWSQSEPPGMVEDSNQGGN